jgi:hypothetical protein
MERAGRSALDLVARLVVLAAEEDVGHGHAALLLLLHVGDVRAILDRLLLGSSACCFASGRGGLGIALAVTSKISSFSLGFRSAGAFASSVRAFSWSAIRRNSPRSSLRS